jgi:hypothetical protein
MRDYIADYLSRNFSLVPVQTKAKMPAIPWKEFTERRASAEELSASFERTGAKKIGIITGSVSGIVVLDVDGEEGEETITLLGGIPSTPTVRTARGYHYYFKHPGPGLKVRNFAKRLPGLDLRGDGGLVVAPPSVRENGVEYKWVVRLEDTPLADIPDWLLPHLDLVDSTIEETTPHAAVFGPSDPSCSETSSYGRASLERECQSLRNAPRGQRNHMLNIASCKLANLIAGKQLSQREVFDALMEASTENRLIADDGRQQVARTIGSGFKVGFRSPRMPELFADDEQDGEHPTVRLDTPINGDEIPAGAIIRMRQEFPKYNHAPSEKFWKGLHQITKAIEGMACRLHEHPDIDHICPGWSSSFFISFLPCGMGKTTALIESAKTILDVPKYDHVGFVIFLSRLEEIRTVVERMGLSTESFSVLTSDEKMNALGNQNKRAARVLFTTQQMLERRAKGVASFDAIRDFHFNERPRQVRVWDEAILPSKIFTLERDQILGLIRGIRRADQELGNQVEAFADRLKATGEGDVIDVPEFIGENTSLEDTQAFLSHKEDRGAFEALCDLQGRLVRVKKDQYGTTTLQYKDILPDDLAPMLILDASGQQRATYKLWATGRKTLHFLDSPQKDYAGLTIHHWNEGSGKLSQIKGKYGFIAEGIAKTIRDEVPHGEKCLIVYYKTISKLPDLIRANVYNPDAVQFVHWGKHTATNEYSDIKYVFLAGVLQYNTPEYEVTGIAAKGSKIEEALTEQEFRSVRFGEIAHHILQAACRGTVRQSVGDSCPPGCHLYVIYSTQQPNGIPDDLLKRIFPGAEYKDWLPIFKVTGRQQKQLVALLQRADKPSTLEKTVLRQRLKIRDSHNLDRLLNDPHVVGYLKDRGTVYTHDGNQVIVDQAPVPF